MKRLRAGIQIIIKVTITLASGKKQVISVTVQKTTVRTTKITGLKSSVTVARNKKLTLKPDISPITSQEKVTYSSSNKKIATVSSSGVITGKKKGTEKLSMIQFQKEQGKYGKILPHGMELFWRNGIMILTMCM